MSFRPAYDLRKVLDLDAAIFPYDEPADVLRPLSRWWILPGKAFCGAWPVDSERVFLARAGVMPEARGQGIHHRMIRLRERWARRQGAKEALTYTSLANLASANNLADCGYRLYRPRAEWAGPMLYWIKDL